MFSKIVVVLLHKFFKGFYLVSEDWKYTHDLHCKVMESASMCLQLIEKQIWLDWGRVCWSKSGLSSEVFNNWDSVYILHYTSTSILWERPIFLVLWNQSFLSWTLFRDMHLITATSRLYLKKLILNSVTCLIPQQWIDSAAVKSPFYFYKLWREIDIFLSKLAVKVVIFGWHRISHQWIELETLGKG